MATSFKRLMRLLQLLPRAPQYIDTSQLEEELTADGIRATRRTLQRDLVSLERMGFAIECIDAAKPYRWRFLDSVPPRMATRALGTVLLDRPTTGRGGIQVELLVARDLTAWMQENPGWQKKDGAPGKMSGSVVSTVNDTPRFRAYLLSLGDTVEVRRPSALRSFVAETLRRAVQHYSNVEGESEVGKA